MPLLDEYWTDGHALVVSRTRRHASIRDTKGNEYLAKPHGKAEELVVGDVVAFSVNDEECQLLSIIERKNCLTRSYGTAVKKLGANIDHIFIISSIEPSPNLAFIDRVLVAAHYADIPSSLVINKTDLGVARVQEEIDLYTSLGYNIVQTSAKDASGLEALVSTLSLPENEMCILTGVSGVGKSSLLNALIPEANRRIGELSDKTGQGTQTTSQSRAYVFQEDESQTSYLIDLPGVQNFGVTNLDWREVAAAFPEIIEYAKKCEFLDCHHLEEQNCAVLEAVENSSIAFSRYESYVTILDEIDLVKPY